MRTVAVAWPRAIINIRDNVDSMRVDEQGRMICENAEVLKDYKWTSRQE